MGFSLLRQLAIACIIFALNISSFALAQDLESEPDAQGSGQAASSDQEIESLYDKEETKIEKKPRAQSVDRAEPKEVQSLSDLATLAPFDDVAIIQRRFLPKTGRFELSGTGFTNLNNPFFTSIGVGLRAAYYFRERYAVEGLFNFATTASRQVTDDLQSNRRISTANMVTSKGFLGAAFKWNPIYGKITWLNKTIVPFDLNFNAGFGMTQTTENDSCPTFHLGTSQVFAISKSMAFRWDIMWNVYSGEATNELGVKENLTQNDLFLGLGMSIYFPEASYR